MGRLPASGRPLAPLPRGRGRSLKARVAFFRATRDGGRTRSGNYTSISLPSWLTESFCRHRKDNGRTVAAARLMPLVGVLNPAGAACFFSSKIVEAAKSRRQGRDPNEVACLECNCLRYRTVRCRGGPRPAATGGAARFECYTGLDAVQYSVRHADLGGARPGLIQAAIAEAKKRNWAMNVAVVDPNGDLIAFARMDGAQLASIPISQQQGARCGTVSASHGCVRDRRAKVRLQLPADA